MLLLAVSGGASVWIPIICVIVAGILFAIAAFWKTDPPAAWNRLVSAGLFFWVLATFISMVGGL